MPRLTKDGRGRRSNSPNLEKAADRGSSGSKTSPRRFDLSKPETQGSGLGVTVSREYNDAFPGITNKETVAVGFDDLFKRNKLSGEINPQNKSGKISIGIGSRQIGGNLGISIDFRDGWIPNIAVDIGAKIAGIGGNLGINTRGGAKIGIGVGAGSIEVAVDKQGSKTATFCFGVPGFEVCNEYSRTKKDPQPLLATPRPIKPKITTPKPKKPKKPKLPIAKKRTKPKPKPKKPKPKPVPRPKPVPKPIKPKRPSVPPKLKPVPVPKPKPEPNEPIPPQRPAPPPKPPSPIKPKRPNPWPRTEPTPTPTPTPTPAPTPKSLTKCSTGNWTAGSIEREFINGVLGEYQFCEASEYIQIHAMHAIRRTLNSTANFNSEQLKNPEYWERYYANELWGNGNWKVVTVEFSEFFPNIPGYQSDAIQDGYIGNWYWNKSIRNTTAVKKTNTTGLNGAIKAKWKFKKRVYDHQPGTPQYSFGNLVGVGFDYSAEIVDIVPSPLCSDGSNPNIPTPTPPTPTPKYNPPPLPGKPTKIKPMNCCADIKEIYKYLGIAKLKKNKFKVAKAFMVPGGTGNEECEDYYQLQQALFRMLANGLIINPISKPLGTEWKSVNATAWAGQVYEMTAEAMSNGNSSQKYEIAMMMQITQLLTIVAEQTRKIEFLSEVLGTEPDLEIEELAACFTIYEGHKGFEKKAPKKIDIGKAKTDDEVEAVLGKMLKPSKIPITKWVLKADSKSIVEILLDQ